MPIEKLLLTNTLFFSVVDLTKVNRMLSVTNPLAIKHKSEVLEQFTSKAVKSSQFLLNSVRRTLLVKLNKECLIFLQ